MCVKATDRTGNVDGLEGKNYNRTQVKEFYSTLQKYKEKERRNMKKKSILALILVVAVVFSLTGIPAASATGLAGKNNKASNSAMPSEYKAVLDTYYQIIYSDWYRALSAEDLLNMGVCPLLTGFDSSDMKNFGYYLEDINGDGTPELFLGIDNEVYNDQVYQLYTVFGGKLACLYTATGEDDVYLLTDGLLEYENWGIEDGYAMLVYCIERNGNIYVTEGILYDENAWRGPYFSVTDDSFDASAGKPISQNQYNQKAEIVMAKEKYLRYTPISRWNSGTSSQPGSGSQQTTGYGTGKTGSSSKPQVNTGSASTMYYIHETLTDRTTGVKTANVLVPYGWNASLNVDWNYVDCSTPGVATVTLTSPDGKVSIGLQSAMQFYDIYNNGNTTGQGIDYSLYCTKMTYHNAHEMVELSAQNSYPGARLVKSYPVSDDIVRMLKEGAQVRLQSMIRTSGGKGLASEGSAADDLYQSGNKYIEYLAFVIAAADQADTGHVVVTTISWNLPFNAVFTADSKQSYDQYRDVFLNVVSNSGFTNEFLYVNLQYGASIGNAILSGRLEMIQQSLSSSARGWSSDYTSQNGYDSDKMMSQWSDVIKEQNDYTTLDGDTIKVSTQYDTVYQDGDTFYLGPDGQSPYGWTRLYPN